MKNWIFLRRDGIDEYIETIARSCDSKVTLTSEFIYKDSNNPIVLQGIKNSQLITQCWEDNRDFYYIDNGYFGNERNKKAVWRRIIKNNIQHDKIILRSDDRWKKFNIKLEPWKKTGGDILIAKPHEDSCKFYGIDVEQWMSDTIETIEKYTDRTIKIRDYTSKGTSLKQALDDDIFTLVTFNSTAATEAIMYGYPAFTLAPCHAAKPVSSQDLTRIENPYYPDRDKLYSWVCHLAYGQVHNDELNCGIVSTILENNIT